MNTSELPELFGIVRMQAAGGLCVQICKAEYLPSHSRGSRDYNIVHNVHPRFFEPRGVEFEMTHDHRNGGLQFVRYRHPLTEELQEVYCWTLPFRMMGRGRIIPVLDFQYRAWLPSNYEPFPVHYSNAVVSRITQEFQGERLGEIQRIEDLESRPLVSWNDSTRPRYQTPNERRVRYTPEIRLVEVERIVVEVKAQLLPKPVGDILLANARLGAESCPILAMPFKDCDKLCVTSCFHIFDSESLTTWRTDHASCPVCRTKIENTVFE